MDATLQRLIEAEMRAEQIARKAEEERESIIQAALMEARGIEDQFEASIPELHASFIERAESRAVQTIAEVKRRYEERHAQLRELAEEREDEALEAAFAILLSDES